jgi:O-antigen/teichoic acid export membrane protein
VWRFCLLLLPSAFLAPAVAYSVFYQVLSAHGDRMAGFMQAAIGISLAIRGVLGAASQVFLTPLVNRAGTFAERIERANQFQKTLFLLVGVVVPPVVLLSGTVVRILYSAEFMPGAPFVVLFVGVEVLALAVGIYQAVLIAMENIVFYVIQNALAQIAMYVVAITTIPSLGITGAALASLSAQAVLLVGTMGYLGWRYTLRLPLRLVGLFFFVLAVLGGAGLASVRYPGIGLVALGWKALFYVVASGILSVFLDRQDWSNLRRVVGLSPSDREDGGQASP